jgi:hypothetical protein
VKEDSAQLAGKLRLEERITPFKLRVNNDTDAEGACQFDSAADQLRLVRAGCERITKEEVRATTIAWLRENPGYRLSEEPGNTDTLSSWVSDTQGITWDAYVAGMAAPFAWGDEITLKGIVEAFRVRIMLLSSTVDPDNYYSLHRPKGVANADDCPTLWMCHFLEVHYGSLLSDLEYDRRQEDKRKRFLGAMRSLGPEKQLEALCDIVLLDNARLFANCTKIFVMDSWKQSGGNFGLAMEMIEAVENKVLTVPLRRLNQYGGGAGAGATLAADEKLQTELSQALTIIKSLKDENAALLRQKSETVAQVPVGENLSWNTLVDEDGKKWLRAVYSIPDSEAGDMLSLHRLALHGASGKLCQRLPLPSSLSGALLFEFPVTVGHYELQYSRKGAVRVRSEPFLNRPHVQLGISIVDGRRLDVEWTMTDASVALASDWIAIYREDEQLLQNYLCFSFVNPASNLVSLHLPVTQVGVTKLVARYFCGDNKWYPVASLPFQL